MGVPPPTPGECLHDHPSQRLMTKVPGVQNWNLEMLVFEERGKPEYPEKNLLEEKKAEAHLQDA